MYKTKDLQNPNNLVAISLFGSLAHVSREKLKSVPMVAVSKVPPHLIDSVDAFQLCRLWPEFVSTNKSKHSNVKFPLPFHPVLNYFCYSRIQMTYCKFKLIRVN